MNYKNLVLSLGLAAAASGVASAQTPVDNPNPAVKYSESKLTFNLTLEYQVPNLKPKNSEGKAVAGLRRTTNKWLVDKTPKTGISNTYTYNELGQTSVKVRYGNREILDDLAAEGKITSSVGWYLTGFANPQGQIVAIYARHATQAAIRIDQAPNLHLQMPGVTIPPLTQLPTDVPVPASDNAVDTYSYEGYTRHDIRTDANIKTYYAKGLRKTTTRENLTFTFGTRFTAPLAGQVRLVTESNVNAGAPYPPTWIVKSIKSTGVILAGRRNVLDEANLPRNVSVIADGTITGTAGTPYFVSGIGTSPTLPLGVTLP